MSEAQRENIARWADLIFKIATPIALAALFFLKSSFATRPELQAVSDRISAIEATLAVMVEQNRTNERQDKRLEDHETRLRVVEFRRQ